MRLHELLRLVGGKKLWKSVRVASSWCLGKHFCWSLILLPAFLHVWNLPIVSVPLGIELRWVLPSCNLEMWLCWDDVGDWWRGVLFFIFRVSPGYRQSIAGNAWVVLPCVVLCRLGFRLGLRLARETYLFVCTCIFDWSLDFGCRCGEICVPLCFSRKWSKITNNNDRIDAASTIWFLIFMPQKASNIKRNRWLLAHSVPCWLTLICTDFSDFPNARRPMVICVSGKRCTDFKWWYMMATTWKIDATLENRKRWWITVNCGIMVVYGTEHARGITLRICFLPPS